MPDSHDYMQQNKIALNSLQQKGIPENVKIRDASKKSLFRHEKDFSNLLLHLAAGFFTGHFYIFCRGYTCRHFESVLEIFIFLGDFYKPER